VLARGPASAKASARSRRSSRWELRANVDHEAILEDLGSKNGRFVNGERAISPVRLNDRDEIGVGSFRLKFRILAPQPSTETRGGD
jgi:pSer/pThr/pTyr-binding forkhead associated (FHA) protein